MSQNRRTPSGVGRASLLELRSLFETGRGDVATLELLSAELKKRPGDAAFDLLLEVAPALVAARKTQPIDQQHVVQRILTKRGQSRPDSRPLYRYRLTTDEWCEVRKHLSALNRSGSLERADDRDAGAFAIYAAEWFRREFDGGVYRWEELLAGLGGLDDETTAGLAKRGLKWWGRTPYRTDHGEQRLMSLALEGGFPTRLLVSRDQGWLSGTLRRLISRTAKLSDPGLEAIVELAGADTSLPATFRRPEFLSLLAELTAAIVALRREYGPLAGNAGMPTSVWLDAQHDGWRDELPIALEGASASKLIDELISQSLERMQGAGARCWRMLIRRNGIWTPALRIAVEGELRAPAEIRDLQTRVRVYAVGDLGDRISGELALLDPPGEFGAWLARPRPGAPKLPIEDYPFSASATVELRSEGRRVATLNWSSGGDPIKADVLAFIDEADSDDVPDQLTLLGTGSQRAPQRAIYVWAPGGYAAHAADGTLLSPIWESEDQKLFRIVTASYVGEADEDFAFHYEPGATAMRAEVLGIEGRLSRNLFGARDASVFLGRPRLTVREHGAARTSNFNEVFWRTAGERRWRDTRRETLGFGELDIIWRTAERALRDRRRIVVLPDDLELRARSLGAGRAAFELHGAEGWRLEAKETDASIAEHSGRGFTLQWAAQPRHTVRLALVSLAREQILLQTGFPLGEGAFVSADGAVLPPRALVTLAALRGARAIVPGRRKLAIEATSGRLRTLYHHIFEDECSLWGLRDRIAALMEASGDLDAEISVGVEPNGPSVRVRRYEHDLEVSQQTVRLSKVPAQWTGELSLIWRSLVDMTPEGAVKVASISVADALSRRAFPLPSSIVGPGVVYLCEGERVASRARFAQLRSLPTDGHNRLQQAIMGEASVCEEALRGAFQSIEADVADAAQELEWLHAAVAATSQLPPTTFNLFKQISRHSQMLAHLVAASVDDAALERAWRLESELPFIWVLVSVEDWRRAFRAQQTRTALALRRIGWSEEQAEATAKAQVEHTVSRFLFLEEILQPVFAVAGLHQAPPWASRTPKEIAQDRIRRLAGAEPARSESVFMIDRDLKPLLLELREWFAEFHPEHWEGLQAPLVAALRATDRVSLTSTHRLRIREASLDDPEHFAEAYAAAIAHLSTNRIEQSV